MQESTFSWICLGGQLPRACDRCNAVKGRCDWLVDQQQCQRCLRLGRSCTVDRPRRRPGRRSGVRAAQTQSLRSQGSAPAHLPSAPSGNASLAAASPSPSCIAEFGDISNRDRQLLQRLLFQCNLLEIFSVGTSFTGKVREQVVPHLLLSKSTFLDGLLGCALSWAGDVDDCPDSRLLTSCYRYAASAVSTLASMQVTNFESMIDCIMLGALVSTFAVKLRLNDVQAICGQTLGLVEPVYAVSDPGRPELRVFLGCMVMWELRGCIFSCSVPSLRFKPPLEAYADRHVGLCGTLLPLLYDVCKISHDLAQGQGEDANIQSRLDVLERSIRQWQPLAPEDFNTRFKGLEISHMLCQAQVMRLAVLLLIHRLRHPFGLNDGPAQVLSLSIITQLETTFLVTRQHVRCTDFALLVACLELKDDDREKWSSNIPMFAGFSPQFGEHVRKMLTSCWTAIDAFDVLSWDFLTTLASPFLRPAS